MNARINVDETTILIVNDEGVGAGRTELTIVKRLPNQITLTTSVKLDAWQVGELYDALKEMVS